MTIFWFFLPLASLGAQGSQGAQKKIFRYATLGEPTSLDQQVTISHLTTTIAQHIFEGLYTFNAAYVPVPLLASSEKISEKGKVIDVNLRRNVPFHNGKEMTSKDVLASLNRWGRHGARGRVFFAEVDSIARKGKYGIRIVFKQPFGPWKNLLAFSNGGPVIYPYEIASKASEKPLAVKDYIGTGPYTMGEWQANRYLEIVKFNDYNSPKGESDGYGGERIAFFNKIFFVPVPEATTRVRGVQAGDFDYAAEIPSDLYDELKSNPKVRRIVNQEAAFGLVFLNSAAGLLKNNYPLRRAILTAIDVRAILSSVIGSPALWKSSSSFMPESSFWFSKNGSSLYSEGDPKKARRMARRAGYRNQPIKVMVAQGNPHQQEMTMALVAQLEKADFKITLNAYDPDDWSSKRNDREAWDLFYAQHDFVPDPILLDFMNDNYPGWWATKEKAKLSEAFVTTTDQRKRKGTWNELQSLIYQQVPAMKLGNAFTYSLASPDLKGIKDTSLVWPKFWGISF